jgi:hypothetical protein
MVSKRGRAFYARVLAAGAIGGLSVEPLDRRVSCARRARARWSALDILGRIARRPRRMAS